MDEAVTKQQALESCPFCGPGESVVSLWHDDMANRWRVGCGRCGASSGIHPTDKTEAPAIAAWNRRSPPSAPRAEAVEAKDAQRYRAFFKAGLPITFLGVDYYDKASLDAAIDAAIAQGADEGEES